MSQNRIKLLNLFLLLMLMMSACGTSNPVELIPDVEIPGVSDSQDQPVEMDTPPVADQPLFGDVITNVIEQCRSAALNQACHHGEISDLSAGQTFRAESASLDSYDIWVFRLQAPGVGSDFESLLILAAGNTEVRFDEIFIGRDETNQNLPRLVFSTTDGADFSSGLVIINESEEDLLSLEANGVGLTLGSTAVVTSKPGDKMTVTMKTGTVAVSANEETVHAAKGESVKVTMTADSKPADVPTSADEDGEIMITPLSPPNKNKADEFVAINFTRENYHEFESAYNRCINGDARQVYRLMYFAQLLLENQNPIRADDILFILTPSRVNEMKEKVKQCATFELIITGSQQGSSSLSWASKVSGDVMKLQFDHNGKLVAPVEGELAVTEFSPSMPLPPGCTSTTETANNVMRVQEYSTLKIYYNTMRIRLYFWPNPVTEKLILNCPSAPPVELPLDWNTYFWYLHPDLLRKENQSYLIQNWEYTGGQIYAEAFYLGRSGSIEEGTVTSDTALTLMHTPQK